MHTDTRFPSLEIIADALEGNDEANRIELTEEQIAEAIAALDSSPRCRAQFMKRILPDGVSVAPDVYARLYKIAWITGFKDSGAEVVGRLWESILSSVNEKEQQSLLKHLPEGHEFFMLLRSLPFLLNRIRFDPAFLIQLLIELREKIANDMMQGGYWRGIEAWASSFPDDASQGLQLLLQRNLGDDGVAIGAAILGSLRVVGEREDGSPLSAEVAEKLALHPDVQKRLVYHRSWINTGWIRGLSEAEFQNCLSRMGEGTGEERSEAFNFLRCLMVDGRTPRGSLNYGLAWLTQEADSSLSDNSKHWVATIVHNLGRRWVQDDELLESLLPAFVSIQPIPFENKGTWMEVEHLLVELLHNNRPQFERWLLALLDANEEGIRECFRAHGRFEYLCSEMRTHSVVHITAPLLFSTAGHQRHFAFIVYEKLPFDAFPEKMLESRSDNEVALCIFESRRHYLQSEHLSLFLSALLERAETGGAQLRNLFRSELLHQAKNFPGAVLDALKTLSDKSALVQEIVTEAEAYFEKLRFAHNSAINSMEIPGWRRALSIRSRRQNQAIETHQTEFSVLSQFCSTSYLIYGDEGFRYCHDGEIGEFSQMRKMSVSMEMPRLPLIDPEGELARRFDAGRFTERLSQVIAEKEAKTDDS